MKVLPGLDAADTADVPLIKKVTEIFASRAVTFIIDAAKPIRNDEALVNLTFEHIGPECRVEVPQIPTTHIKAILAPTAVVSIAKEIFKEYPVIEVPAMNQLVYFEKQKITVVSSLRKSIDWEFVLLEPDDFEKELQEKGTTYIAKIELLYFRANLPDWGTVIEDFAEGHFSKTDAPLMLHTARLSSPYDEKPLQKKLEDSQPPKTVLHRVVTPRSPFQQKESTFHFFSSIKGFFFASIVRIISIWIRSIPFLSKKVSQNS